MLQKILVYCLCSVNLERHLVVKPQKSFNNHYRTIKCVHILVMTILYIAFIGVLVKVIGEPSRTTIAFLVDVFCYDEMLRVTCLYYERLRKQSKNETKVENQ